MDRQIETEQIARVQELRRTRDDFLLQAKLQQLEKAARSEKNIMPCILAAVQAYGTIGEISDVLRRVWGTYEEPVETFAPA